MATTVDVPKWLDQQRISPFQIRVLVLCALAVLLDGFNTQVIGYLGPAIAKDLHLQSAAMSPVFASGLIGLMIGALAFGPVGDRIGRRLLIIACTVLLGTLSAATALSGTLHGLIAFRFITGLGLGGVMPNAIALTSEYSPHRSRGTMVMVMFCGFPIGATIAGFASASIIPAFGWRGVFVLGGIVPLLLAPILTFALPESLRHLVLGGASSGKVAALLARIKPGSEFGRDTEFVIREQRASGMAVAQLFHQGRALATLLLWIVFFVSLLDLFLLSNWLPTVFHDHGLSLSLAVIATALFQGGGVAGTFGLGPIVDRFGMYRVLAITYFVGTIFIALLGLAHTVVAIMCCTFCAGIGIVGGQTGANALAAAFYPTSIRSTGVGWALGIGRIGSIVGPVLGGIMISLHLPLSTLFISAAIPSLCGSIAIYMMGRTQSVGGSQHPIPSLSPDIAAQ